MIDTKKAAGIYGKILNEVSRIVIGKNEIKEALMLSLIAGGHVLIEGSAGSAKTKLARSFAEAIGGQFKRIQFTPDMMPADITGFYMYSASEDARFIEGPIFTSILLADELNRTTPRTQSALLEAMQEHQVTIEGKCFTLAKPFIVIATQVQAGGEGTYPLTDVQVDRFLLRVLSEYPSRDEEKHVINNIDVIDQSNIKVVATKAEILKLQEMARGVHVSPDLLEYIVAIVNRIRTDPDIFFGPSTRGSIAIYKCARARALLEGRDFVIPDDVKHLATAALEHRVKVKPEAEMDEITPRMVVERVLEEIPVPKLEL